MKGDSKIRLTLVTLLLAAALAAVHATTVDVHISNFTYNPQHVTVNVGDSVRWINDDSVPHTARSGTSFTPSGVFDTGNIPAHTMSAPIQFNTAGQIFYYCNTHKSGMTQGNNYSVIVNAPTSMSGHVDLQGWLPSPAGQSATIEFRTPNTTTVVNSYPIVLDGSGNYSASPVASGTFDVAVKFGHWLRSLLEDKVVTGGVNNVMDFSCVNGDSDPSNAIDIFDLNKELTLFGSGPDPLADLDGNAVIDVFDLNTVLSKFGLVGPP